MQQTEKYWNIIFRVVLTASIIMLAVGVVLAFIPKINQMNSYQQIKQDLQEEIDQNIAAEKELRQQHDRCKTDPSFVEKVAHEVGYAREDEVIYQFPEKNSSTNGYSY